MGKVYEVEPRCTGSGHYWCEPDWLGDDEVAVCAACGVYQFYSEDSDSVQYREADERSEKWMHTYEVYCVDGGQTTIEADDWSDVEPLAEEWVLSGDWGDQSCYIPYTIVCPNGDRLRYEALHECEAEEPDCIEGHEHSWRDRGTWALQGTQIRIIDVCRHCGIERVYTSESTAGQCPHEPPSTEYRAPEK